MSDPTFTDKFVNNSDTQNRRIASDVLIEKAIRSERRRELDLYKKYASDDDFKKGIHGAVLRMMEHVLSEGRSLPG